MNLLELKIVDSLKRLKEEYAVEGVKAEFEAEGTRTEELMRLKEICLAAQVSLTLKIGGCEAIRDMYDARAVGVDYLVAPMVETPFALEKYLRAIDIVFPNDEQENVDFLVNIETLYAVNNFPSMLKSPQINKLNGIVVGRVDLSGSMGLDRSAVNEQKMFDLTKSTLEKARQKNLSCVVGGAISVEAIDFLRNLPEDLIDRYETRKICFLMSQVKSSKASEGINKAVEFELLWLQNKRNYYKAISQEDDKRIAMLSARCQKL
ncbi:MAG: aldolase/citrate lyase family protein [Candidatus Omnitrophica bacterium]|nr:aldolase/citrate lyase family protein [Candidatus Omnitrophota bacterium]MDD5429429.1 aldolase/citrate lyase family protein [Candidatus Omnitrophota bacterium]